MRSSILLLLGVLAWPLPLPAEDAAAVPPPHAPLVAPVQENAGWVVAVTDVNQPAGQKPPAKPASATDGDSVQLQEIRITKTGRLKRDVLLFSNGTNVEVWYVKGLLVATTPSKQPTVVDYKAMEARYGSGLAATESDGFTGLGWLDLRLYDHTVIYKGQPCYHYHQGTTGAEAWINAASGLPAAYTTGGDGKLYTYRFIDPPSTPLTLPDEDNAAVARYQKDRDRLQRLQDASAALRRP